MDLTVKLMSGESREVRVREGATVSELRHVTAQAFNVAASRVRLSANNGRHVTLDDDNSPLSKYNLRSGSSVSLLVLPSSQVFVKNEKGQTNTYDVLEEETVADLQQKIYNRDRTPVDQQRLIYGGQQMEPNHRLKDYGVTNGSTIHQTLRLRGG